MVEVLRSKQAAYAEKGVTLHVEEDPFIVVLLTPIMKRAHEQDFAGEIVFVDSSGSCDQGDSSVTFMFGASKVGGVPLACVIHKEQTEANYSGAFRAVKEAVGPQAFGGKGAPATLMTDDSGPERKALKTHFPLAYLLLCIFHVCQAIWRWLCESSHGIKKDSRQALMSLFRDVLYAPTEDTCNAAYKRLKNAEVSNPIRNLSNILNRICGKSA